MPVVRVSAAITIILALILRDIQEMTLPQCKMSILRTCPIQLSGTFLLRTSKFNEDTSLIGTLPDVPASYIEKCTKKNLRNKDTSLIKTLYVVPRVSTIKRFY